MLGSCVHLFGFSVNAFDTTRLPNFKVWKYFFFQISYAILIKRAIFPQILKKNVVHLVSSTWNTLYSCIASRHHPRETNSRECSALIIYPDPVRVSNLLWIQTKSWKCVVWAAYIYPGLKLRILPTKHSAHTNKNTYELTFSDHGSWHRRYTLRLLA